jgi:hypothetical protein
MQLSQLFLKTNILILMIKHPIPYFLLRRILMNSDLILKILSSQYRMRHLVWFCVDYLKTFIILLS